MRLDPREQRQLAKMERFLTIGDPALAAWAARVGEPRDAERGPGRGWAPRSPWACALGVALLAPIPLLILAAIGGALALMLVGVAAITAPIVAAVLSLR